MATRGVPPQYECPGWSAPTEDRSPTQLPQDETVSGLSASLLDETDDAFTLAGQRQMGGLPRVKKLADFAQYQRMADFEGKQFTPKAVASPATSVETDER